MGQRAKLHGQGKLFDWMKYVDRRARSLPPAKTMWTDPTYPLFFFARYSRLRPSSMRTKRLDEALHNAGHESLARMLSDREKQIAAQRETQRAVADLTSAQRIQLAALLIDTLDDIEIYMGRKRASDWSHTLGREGPRRQRLLLRKLERARSSLSELYQYASGLDPSLGFHYRKAADEALAQLADLPKCRSFENHSAIHRELRQAIKDPRTYGMVQLYWFFRSGCGLTGDEAEVRTALLRNAFWKAAGVAEVDFRPEYRTGQSKGCQAVHEAVRRFHPNKGTSA